MARNYVDVDVEDQLFAEIEQRRVTQRALIATSTPQQAQLASGLSNAYPWLDPGVVQALTRAGLSADSTEALQVAQLAGVTALQDGVFEEPAPNVPDGWFGSLWHTVTGPVGQGLLNLARGSVAVLSSPFEEVFERIIPAAQVAKTDTVGDWAGPLDWGPFDEVAALTQGDFWERFWTNLTEKAGPSTLALTIGDIASPDRSPTLFSNDKSDPNAGLFGAFNRRQQLRGRLTQDGMTATLGRHLARDVFEADSTPYNILSGVFDFAANVAVPVDLGVGKASRALGLVSKTQIIAQGGRLGLLPGVAKRVNVTQAIDGYLSNPRTGGKLINYLTDEKDMRVIWETLGRPDPALARQFAETTDIGATADLLRSTLGSTIREVPTAGPVGRTVGSITGGDYGSLFGPGAALRENLSNVRLIHEMPGLKLNPKDIRGSARTINDFVRNANLGDEVATKYLNRLTDLEVGDSRGMYDLTMDMLEDTMNSVLSRKTLVGGKAKFTPGEARKITRAYRNTYEDLKLYATDALGRNEDILGSRRIIDGERVDFTPTPHMLTELVDGSIPLPNPRDIRRATSFAGRAFDIPKIGPALSNSVAFADWTMGKLWKPVQLLTRFAYPVRVLGEEQVRMAAAGYDSLFHHPFSYIAYMTGRKGKLPDELKGMVDEVLEFQQAMSRGSAGWRGMPGEILTGRWVRVDQTHPDYLRGVATEFGQMANEPVMQRVAGGLAADDLKSIGMGADDLGADSLDAVKEWFWQGTGQKFRKQLAEIEGKEILGATGIEARQAADAYIDTYAKRLRVKTGQHPDLIEAVAKGKIGDKSLRNLKERQVGQAFEDYLDVLPPKVKVEEVLAGRSNLYDRATEFMFSAMMSRPTNYLSRSPVFHQAYWQRAEELLPYATREVGEQMIREAASAGFSRTDLRRFAGILNQGSGAHVQSWDEFDTISKAFGLDTTRELLYDLSKRSQFFDSARLIFPFGEAWKEIFTAWSKIVSDNPSILRRFQQTINGGLGPGFGGLTSEFLGTGLTPGQGFFYDDPVTGEMMFNYPGSTLASKFLLGSDKTQVAFSGTVAGLNLFSATVLPGVGPVVQIPFSVVGLDRLHLDETLHDLIFPFGEPDVEGGLLEANLPAWMNKIRTAIMGDPDADRLYANTVMDVMRALVSSGEYSTNSPQEIERLYDSAVARATGLFWMRGIAQSTFPTGPSLRWSTEDLQGNMVPMKILSDEFRRLMEVYNGDSDKALGEWMRRFGTENTLALQGKTRELVYRPLVEEGDDWIKAHDDIATDYGLTIGFFAPDPADGNFDYAAYLRTIDEGFRQQLAPREMVALSNSFLGRLSWEHAKTLVNGRTDPEAQLWLAQIRDQIADEYPGYDGYIPTKARPASEDLINEVLVAANDPRLATTDTAQGVLIYEEARQAAQTAIDNNPNFTSKGFTSSKETAYLRDWLRAVAEEIIREHPSFAPVWNRIFSNELAE